jgi:hypothetical protein
MLCGILNWPGSVPGSPHDFSSFPLLLAGLNSAGVPIGETITVPAGTPGPIASQRDYLTVGVTVSPTGFTAPVQVGTSALGSTQWYIPSHYTAAFNIGCSVSVPSGTTCSVEVTRDYAFAAPQIYVPGQGIVPPVCDAFAWPTLSAIATETSGDIDSSVSGVRLTVTAGTGRATLANGPDRVEDMTMHEDDHVEVRHHRRKRPSVAHGEVASARHDRAGRSAVHPYTSASVPTMREAMLEDWRPEARQDSWSSAAHMDPPRDDRRPAHDPHRPLDITDHRYVTRRSAPEPGNPYSAAHRLERAEPFRPRGGHQDDTPI